MSYTRIVNRRGTASQWTSSNPILAAGEFGFESDTGKFKIGNGSSNWSALDYFANATVIKSDLIDNAPAALDTLNELAAALNDDENFATSITQLIGTKAPSISPTFSGTVDFSGAVVSGIILPINWLGEYNSETTYAENDMVQYQGSVYYATGPDINGTFVPGFGDWELFASKGDTGDAATISVGSVSTGDPGTSANVYNSGTQYDAILDFTIPKGYDGADGGFDSAQVIESKSSNYTLTSADAGKLFTNSAAITITVQGLLVGQQADFVQISSNQITFAAGSGMTLYSKNSKLKTASQYSPATIKCVSANTYVLIGDIGD